MEIKVDVVEAPDILIATVPLELTIIVDTRGDVTVPTDAKIINHTDRPIKVTAVKFRNSAEIDTQINGVSNVGTKKEMLLKINGVPIVNGNTSNSYFVALAHGMGNYPNIPAQDELTLDVEAKVNKAIYENITSESLNAGTLQYTIAFAD